MIKRIISIVTAILMMLQIMMICPIELSAETPPQTTTYTGTGYTVEYTVKSSWDKTQNIGIKLNNTSDSPMSVWALKYNAHGEIRELYNGEVYKNEGTEYIIRSTSSNSSIEAGKSVEFGYSLTGENLSVPESIVLCSEQREANEAEYSVEFQLSEQWNPTYTAKIVLNNLSQFEMSGWSLSYDSNATVENIWNGKLISQNNGRITVSGSAENFTLTTGGTTEININGKVSYETPAAENFKLIYTYINADIEDDNNGEEKEDLVIFAFGNYDEETDNLEVSWYSNTEKGTYEVLKSEDNISYTTIASVTDTDSCSVAGTSLNNGTQYFKVKVTDESGRTAESIPFEVTKNENGVTSEYIDTDKDGLADYLEEILGTDPNKADTDNDELTDYDEIYITGTDPLKADTDGNGRLDSKEDPDNDGLNNIQEIGLKTDPLNPDTDGDGLTDGDEYNIYWTLPTKYDTDDDGIGDGDEIKIGLNPKNPKTYGMPDTEYTIPQEVTADSEAMSEINTEDNPYELSVEVKAAGNAENISVSESGYANAMHNDAILGIIPELSYDSNCKVDEVVVKFKLEEEALTEKTELPELKGIQRYQIFKFFEDDNMLLPIITEYNEATNTISATTDCMGTYCVMDMGNFLSSIAAIENEEVTEEPTPMLMSLNAEAPKLTVKPEDEFNVVFAVDTRFAGTATWETILESISGSAEEIFSRSPKATVYLLEQNMPSATGDSVEEVGTYTNYDELTTAFEEYKNKESVINPLNQCDMSEAIDYVNKNIGKTLPTFMFSFLEPQGAKYNKQKRDETINGINPTTDICLVLNNVTPSDTSFGSAAINNKAENVFKSYDSEDDIVNHIYDEKQVQTTYTIINSCGLKDVELKEPLTYKCFQAARGITTDYSGLADTDDDGLFDFQEIDCLSTLFTIDDYGEVFEYPNYAECLVAKDGKEFYVDVGLEKYKAELKKKNKYVPQSYLDCLLYTTKVLPINSDPTDVDSDNDGYLDCLNNNLDKSQYGDVEDPRPLKNDVQIYKLKNDGYLPVYYYGNEYDAILGSDMFIGFRKDVPNYGGNQSWFYDENNAAINDLESKHLENGGCGIIASCDVLLYLQKYHGYKFSSVVDIAEKGKPISDKEKSSLYQDYNYFVRNYSKTYLQPLDIEDLDEILAVIAMVLRGDVYTQNEDVALKFEMIIDKITKDAGTLGVSHHNLESGFNQYAKDTQNNISLNYIPNYYVGSNGCVVINDHLEKVKCSLKKDYPIIVYNGLTWWFKIKMDDDDNYNEIGPHYFVITGLTIDNVKGTAFVEISSWGKHGIVQWSDLYLTSGINGGVYIIE